MLKVRDVTHRFGEKEVLHGVSLAAAPGDRIHLSGPSGAGKTTLLSIIAELLIPTEGEAVLAGTVAYMFQEPRLLPWLNVEANVRFALPKAADADLVEKHLRAVELWLDRDKIPTELSGGMCRRVALARALAYAEATGASVILLDEPLTGVDEGTKGRLYPHILQAAEGRVLILSTHDDREAAALCNRTVKI